MVISPEAPIPPEQPKPRRAEISVGVSRPHSYCLPFLNSIAMLSSIKAARKMPDEEGEVRGQGHSTCCLGGIGRKRRMLKQKDLRVCLCGPRSVAASEHRAVVQR